MDWFSQEFVDTCNKYFIEPISNGKEVLFICPKIPPKDAQDRITKGLPKELPFRFIEGLRSETTAGLKILMRNAVADTTRLKIEGRKVTVIIEGQSPHLDRQSQVWEAINELMYQDRYVEEWEITLNGETILVCNKKVFEEIASRKEGKVILDDDVLNLRIALETSEDVLDFIKGL